MLSLLIGLVLILTMLPSSLSGDEQYPPFAELHVGPGETYLTIQDAVDNATDSDQIMVHPGTYNEIVTIEGFRVSMLQITSTDGWESTIIDGSGLSPVYDGVVQIIDSTYVSVSGFTITGGMIGVVIKGINEECYGNDIHECNITGNDYGVAIQSQNEETNYLYLRPNANGSLQEFTSGSYPAVDHWTEVDDVTPDYWATHIYTGHPSKELLNIENHTDEDGEIGGVTVYACTRGQDGSYSNGYTLVINDTVNELESDPFSFQMVWENNSCGWGVNPESNDWTWEDIDDLQIGCIFYDWCDDPFFYITQIYAEVEWYEETGQPTYDNYIVHNIIYNNSNEGIGVDADSNYIYGNNFIDNNAGGSQAYSSGGNTWDDGWEGGGNYWNDFDESSEGAYDDFQGEFQNDSGSDGIVDLGLPDGGLNPYSISFVDQDTYPLIEPYEEEDEYPYGDFSDAKMHYPQYPDPFGNDVAWGPIYEDTPVVLADDWMCTETGNVSNIHFWISTYEDSGVLTEYPFMIEIRSDNRSDYYSKPGELLWSNAFMDYDISEEFTGLQGWMIPDYLYEPENHELFWRIDITNISDPFIQENGTIYWLCIYSPFIETMYQWGWKTSQDSFEDNAVYGFDDLHDMVWYPLNETMPFIDPIDFAFVIMGGPGGLEYGDSTEFPDSKMHFPQYPDPFGWDVDWMTGETNLYLGDDWMCNQTGNITDLHFWISTFEDIGVEPQFAFNVSIYSDDRTGIYSKPGEIQWTELFLQLEYNISEAYLGDQGWIIPGDSYEEHNHQYFWRIDIENISDPFYQENGTIYWLVIQASVNDSMIWGWKTSLDAFEDSAVYGRMEGGELPETNTIYVVGATAACVSEYYISNLTKKANSTAYGGTLRTVIADDNYVYAAGDTTQKVYQYWRNNLTKKAETENYTGGIYEIIQDEEYIYIGGQMGSSPYTNSNVRQYWKSNLTKKAETTAYGGAIWCVDMDEEYIYVGGTVNRVFKYWKSNLTYVTQSPLYGGTCNGLSGVWVDDTHVYASGVGGSGNRYVKKYLKSDLSYVSQTAEQGSVLYNLDGDDEYIYTGNGATANRARQFWKSNMTMKAQTESYGGIPNGITAYGDYLYIGGASGNQVRKYLKTNIATYVNQSASYGGIIYEIGFTELFEDPASPALVWYPLNQTMPFIDPFSFAFVVTGEVEPEPPQRPIFYVDEQFNVSTPGWHVTHWDIIHEAVENASAGHLVLVNGDGDIYNENVFIDKSIDVIGNYTSTRPRINGQSASKSTVEILSDWVNISGFYVDNTIGKASYHGISVGKTQAQMTDQYNVTISDCYITQANYGVLFRGGGYCTAENNEITGGITNGIACIPGSHQFINNNYIHSCTNGIELQYVSYITVTNNNISSNTNNGIRIYVSALTDNVSIYNNNFTSNSQYGVYIGNGNKDNLVYHNNFVNNNGAGIQAYDYGSSLRNHWYLPYPECGNYWDDHGTQDIYSGPNQDFLTSDGICDLHSPDPYNITTGVQDYYPFYAPFNGTTPPAWNAPPVASDEDPMDTETDIGINYPQVLMNITDLEGDLFNVLIHGLYLTNVSLYDQTNGTFTATLAAPLPFDTIITWYVDIQSNSSTLIWNNYTYSFTTEEMPPVVWVDDDQIPGWYDYKHVRTIPEGITNVSAGGLVYIYNGTYKNTAAGAFPNPPGGTTNIRVQKNVTIHGESKDSVIVDAQGRQNCIMINCSTGIVIVEGITAMNWTRRGISQYKEWQPVIIRNNTVIGPDTASGAGNGISASGNYSVIECNRVYGTQIADGACGILLYSASYCLVRWNHITPKVKADNGIGVAGFYYNPPTYNWNWYARNNTIANNTIENTTRGITLEGWVINNSIEYNIIRNTTQHGIRAINVSWSIPAPVDKRPTWVRLCHNNITHSNWSGIYLENTEWLNIEDNFIACSNHSGIEIPVVGNSTLITRNYILYNVQYGILLHDYFNLIYDNYFNNTNNAYDDSPLANTWNVTKTMSPNILGRIYTGGNYWYDYTGLDTNGDFLGDTNLPYNSSGGIFNGGDYLPLTLETLTNLPPDAPFSPQPTNNTEYHTVYDIWLNCTVTDPNGDTMDVYYYWGNGTLIGTISGVSNNTVSHLYLPDYWNRTILGYTNCTWVTHDTTHTWYAIANDTLEQTQGPTWNFHTSKAWDLNTDRNINYLDVSGLVSHYAFRVLPPGADPWDTNEDTYVNYLDVSSVVGHYGETY